MNENHRSGKKPPANNNSNNNNKSSQSPYHESSDLLNRILNKMEASSKHKNSSNYNQLLKSSITNKEGKLQVSSKTYAIVTKVLQNKSKIDALIGGTNILTNSHPIKNMGLFYVMIYELLFASSPQQRKYGTSNKIKGGGTVKRYILQHESVLRQTYQEYYGTTTTTTNTNHPDENNNDNNHRPFQHRFVRVNTCVTTVKDFLQFYSTMLKDAVREGTIRAGSISERIYRDEHVPDLLVIPTLLTSHLLSALQHQNKGNHIVLQDKSSCLPAVCLYSLLRPRRQPPPLLEMNRHPHCSDMHVVLDACAAPGNKTSHIAAVLQQLPTVSSLVPEHHHQLYATDRNVERCHTLQDRMTLLVPTGNIDVVVQNKDFLTISGKNEDRNNEYTKLTCIVLDPSCSGSGLYHRNSMADMNTGLAVEHSHSSDGQQQQRIQKLSNFQITCLRHALTSFPNVHSVIYSTCSIHVLENEHVVASVLSNRNNNHHQPNDNDSHPNLRDEWSIVAPPDLQDWPRRGKDLRRTTNSDTDGDDDDDENDKILGAPDVAELYGDLTQEEIQCFIRTTIEDRTNGFFVACFQRNGKEKKRKSMNGPTQPPPRPPLDEYHHRIPTYRGEFDQLSETHEVVVKDRHTPKRHTPIGNDRRTTGGATTDTTFKNAVVAESSTTGSSRQKRQRDTRVNTTTTSTTGTLAAANHSKKRTKKLEWKQRQHEAKRQRTKNEKGNQKSETTR